MSQLPSEAGYAEVMMPKTLEEIEPKVIEIVIKQFASEKGKVTRETRFQDDLAADSLDVTELIMDLEDEFKITIPDNDIVGMKTVGNVVDYIMKA